jgi:hypothetical protein
VIGELYSFTLVERDSAPSGFEWCAPYLIALVDIEKGPRVTAQMTDLDMDMTTGAWKLPKIGDTVEMVTRKLRDDGDERGMIVYGYKFRKPVR